MDFKDFLNIVKELGFLKHADNSYNTFSAILHTQTHTQHTWGKKIIIGHSLPY